MQTQHRPTQKFYLVVMCILLVASLLLTVVSCDAPGSHNGSGNNICVAQTTNCQQNSSGN